MSCFDEVVQNLIQRNPVTSGHARTLSYIRQMRDKRLVQHITGCAYIKKKLGHELILYVDSPIWAQEFQMSAPAILAEWNVLCEKKGFSQQAQSIKFPVSAQKYVEHTHSSTQDIYSREILPPLTSDEEEYVYKLTTIIQDRTLRKKAQDAIRSSLRWKKSKDNSKDV